MNRVNKNSKEYVLVAWRDSDIPDMIKDKSFVGKLAANSTSNKGIIKYINLC